MRYIHRFLVLVLFLSLIDGVGYGQLFPIQIENISHKQYVGHAQIFPVIQDNHGIMYFGSDGETGILEFDGKNWRRIFTRNRTFTTALGKGLNGTIYVGGNGEFGYLGADSMGRSTYINLSDGLRKDDREFGRIWKIHVEGERVIFQSYHKIFIWQSEVFEVISSGERLQTFIVDGQLFAGQKGVGLTKVVGDKFELIPGGGAFSNHTIMAVLEIEDGLLVFTRDDGVYHLSWKDEFEKAESQVVPRTWTGEVNQYLIVNQVDDAFWLKTGDIGIRTMYGGFVIIDREGNLVHLIDSRAGLQNDMLWGAWEDDQGNLWLGSNNGISRLEYNSPMSTFNEESNFGERVNKILRYNNRIYLATETGVYHYSKADQSILLDNKFTDYNSTVQDVNTLIWDMCEFEGKLLAVSSRGVYMIRGDDVSLISKIRARSISKVVCKDSSSVLIGNNLGQVFYLKFDQNDLVSTHLIEDSLGQIMDIKGVYTKNGELNIWAGTFEHTVVRVRVDSVGRDYKVEVYDTSAGLSPGQIIVHMLKDEIVFGGDKGLYRFNNVQSRFELDPSFVVNYPDTAQKQVFKLYEDRSGKVWVSDGTYLIYGNDVNGKYEWTGIPFYGMDIGHINSVYDDGGGVYWIAGSDGMARYSSKSRKVYEHVYHAHIRKVMNGDNTLFFGTHASNGAKAVMGQGTYLVPELEYENNSISFNYSSTYFEKRDFLRFSYKLVGYDEQWSTWSSETKKEYTNLDEGKYEFRVKAKNVYDQESTVVNYLFEVLTPFYRSYWFYGMQSGFLGLLFVISYYFGKTGGKLSRLAPVMATVAIVILFEYFQNYVEDNFEHLTGGITVVKVLVNVLLVLLLLPLEGMLKRFMNTKTIDR